MSVELKSPPEVGGLPVVVPPHLMEPFEEADRRLRELHGQSPGVMTLVRLWLACSSASRIRQEFEEAVMDIYKGEHNSDEKGDFHADCQ
jgi:hypothetical protein